MADFARDILSELQALIESDDIETLVFRDPGGDARANAAVKLIHRPSGTEVVCDAYESQIMNKAMALVRLAKARGAST